MSSQIRKIKKNMMAQRKTTFIKPRSVRSPVMVAAKKKAETNNQPSANTDTQPPQKTLRSMNAIPTHTVTVGAVPPRDNNDTTTADTEVRFDSVNPSNNTTMGSDAFVANIAIEPDTSNEKEKSVRFKLPVKSFSFAAAAAIGSHAATTAVGAAKMALLTHVEIISNATLSATQTAVITKSLTTLGLSAPKAIALLGNGVTGAAFAAAGAVTAVGLTYAAIKFPKTTFGAVAVGAIGTLGAIAANAGLVAVKSQLLAHIVGGASLSAPIAKTLGLLGMSATNAMSVIGGSSVLTASTIAGACASVVGVGALAAGAYGAYKLGGWLYKKHAERKVARQTATTTPSRFAWLAQPMRVAALATALTLVSPAFNTDGLKQKASNTMFGAWNAAKEYVVTPTKNGAANFVKSLMTTEAPETVAANSSMSSPVFNMDGLKKLGAAVRVQVASYTDHVMKAPLSEAIVADAFLKQPQRPLYPVEQNYANQAEPKRILDGILARHLTKPEIQEFPMLAGLKRGHWVGESQGLPYLRRAPQKFGVMARVQAINNFNMLLAKFDKAPKKPASLDFIPLEMWQRLTKQWKSAKSLAPNEAVVMKAVKTYEAKKDIAALQNKDAVSSANNAIEYYLNLGDAIMATKVDAAKPVALAAYNHADDLSDKMGFAVNQTAIGLRTKRTLAFAEYLAYQDTGKKEHLVKAATWAAVAQEIKSDATTRNLLKNIKQQGPDGRAAYAKATGDAKAIVTFLKRDIYAVDPAFLPKPLFLQAAAGPKILPDAVSNQFKASAHLKEKQQPQQQQAQQEQQPQQPKKATGTAWDHIDTFGKYKISSFTFRPSNG